MLVIGLEAVHVGTAGTLRGEFLRGELGDGFGEQAFSASDDAGRLVGASQVKVLLTATDAEGEFGQGDGVFGSDTHGGRVMLLVSG